MMTMTMLRKACSFVALCGGVAVTCAFSPAAMPPPRLLLRGQQQHQQHFVSSLLSNNLQHPPRPNQRGVVTKTKLWGTSSSPESEPERSSLTIVQLPNSVASFCVASLLAVSLLAGPADMALAASKVAPEPTATETSVMKSNKKSKEAAASVEAKKNQAPAESIAVDNAKATLSADKQKVADLTTQLKKAQSENDQALANANKAQVAAERAKAAYIKENDRLVSLPTSATVNTIIAEKDKVGTCNEQSMNITFQNRRKAILGKRKEKLCAP
jgi:hypothetical protein